MAHSKSIRKGQFPIICHICENDTKINWKCLECDKLMCDNCKQKIHPKFAKDHSVIDIKEVGLHTDETKLTKLDFSQIKCKQHPGQVCCLFCATCDHTVCPTCVSKVHKKHDLMEIIEGYEMKIEGLKKGLSKFSNDKTFLKKERDKLDGLKRNENSRFEVINKNILDQQQVAITTVQQNAKTLIDELGQKQKNTDTAFEQEIKKNKTLRAEVDKKLTQVESIMNNTNISEFFDEVVKMGNSLNDEVPPVNINLVAIPEFIPGNSTINTVGILKSTSTSNPQKADLGRVQEYTTTMSHIQVMSVDTDSIWICSIASDELQRVKSNKDKLKMETMIKLKVFSVAVTPSDDLLLCVKGARLKQISKGTEKLKDSLYSVDPLQPTTVHITKDNKVIVGAWDGTQGIKVVMVMDMQGKHDITYENDRNNLPIFRYPRSITTTSNGNIFVADCRSQDDDGKVIVLDQSGDVLNTYTGNSNVTTNAMPFRTENIKSTPSDYVIAADMDNHTLHVLDNLGNLLKYYNTRENGIYFPCCIAIDKTGQLYVGCSKRKDSLEMAKFFIMNTPGI